MSPTSITGRESGRIFQTLRLQRRRRLACLPEARVGGPDSTGPANPKAAEFLRLFLEHCAHQKIT